MFLSDPTGSQVAICYSAEEGPCGVCRGEGGGVGGTEKWVHCVFVAVTPWGLCVNWKSLIETTPMPASIVRLMLKQPRRFSRASVAIGGENTYDTFKSSYTRLDVSGLEYLNDDTTGLAMERASYVMGRSECLRCRRRNSERSSHRRSRADSQIFACFVSGTRAKVEPNGESLKGARICP